MPAVRLAHEFKTTLELERAAFCALVQEPTGTRLEAWQKAHGATQTAASAYYAHMTAIGEWGGEGYSA